MTPVWRRNQQDQTALERVDRDRAWMEGHRAGHRVGLDTGRAAGRADEYKATRRQINAVLADHGLAPIDSGPLDLGVRNALNRQRGKAGDAVTDYVIAALREWEPTAAVPVDATPQQVASEVTKVIQCAVRAASATNRDQALYVRGGEAVTTTRIRVRRLITLEVTDRDAQVIVQALTLAADMAEDGAAEVYGELAATIDAALPRIGVRVVEGPPGPR